MSLVSFGQPDNASDRREYGFHHFGIAAWNFDRDLDRHHAAGADLAFHLHVPSGGRVAYIDTTASLPGMLELIELGEQFQKTFNRFYRASIGWEGRDPVRPFVAPAPEN